MSPLTHRQQDICSYTGLFGALISGTCLIQLIAITKDHWISYALMVVYLFTIISFSLLALQRHPAPLLLIIGAGLLFAAELVFVLSGVFSLIVLIAFLYNVIIVVLLFIERIHVLLRDKARLERSEALAWREKI